MKTRKESLRKIISVLNNKEEDGGFWLPNIQRPFVWSEEQICRLFDSILRGYPIGTLLVWKTKEEVLGRKFIDNYKETYKQRLHEFLVKPDKTKKTFVLDGQQRLQSLYIGLCGSYSGRELYFGVTSGEGVLYLPADVKYKFIFCEPVDALPTLVKFKDIVFSHEKPREIVEKIIAGQSYPQDTIDRIKDNVDLIREVFHSESGISYQELDSVEEPNLYKIDDIVEVFIRANSGGTKLGKSDLLFSLLASDWDDATTNIEELLAVLNHRGFQFTQDFILKTCLTLLDQKAAYEVAKFRNEKVRIQIQEKWAAISDAIKSVVDFLYGKTRLRCDKALPSYNALIPLIYFRYHYPKEWADAKNVETFLVRTLLAGTFSSHADNVIDTVVNKLKDTGQFNHLDLFDEIQGRAGKNLATSEDRLLSFGYDNPAIHLLFNIWYPEFDYTPAFENSLPQIDHVFPKSLLMKVKKTNPKTGRNDLLRYPMPERNQLANCMLLTAEENLNKRDTPPDVWFKNKSDAYLDKHLIPKDQSLWQIDQFDNFIAERKKLILAKFDYLLYAKPKQ